ncbi:MAG: PD40 domain-containing protein, partial [Anaerolineales bacterium]|nr:PD40 domain-containing protein [Anaerolineales bacterium]
MNSFLWSKRYVVGGLFAALLFLVACLPTTEEPTAPLTDNGGGGLPTPTLAAVAEQPPIVESETAEPAGVGGGNGAEPTAVVDPDGSAGGDGSVPKPTPVLIDGLVKPDDSEMIVTQEESPYQNGWTVKVVDGSERRAVDDDGSEYFYVRVSLSNPNTGESWTVLEEWRRYGLGYEVPALFKWSSDNQSIYYTNLPHPDGCPGFVNGWDLHKFNFTTGEQQTIIHEGGLSIALAPNEFMVAYGAGSMLNLYDANANAVLPVTVNGRVEQMAWSPDMQSVAVTVVENGCTPEAKHTIINVQRVTGETAVLVPPSGQQLAIESWPIFDEIRLTDGNGEVWLLDPNNGEMVSAANIETIDPPAGLIYRSNWDVVKVGANGSETVVATASGLNLSPDGTQGAYFDYPNNQFVLLDLVNGTQEVLSNEFYAVQQVSWMDDQRLLLGVQINESQVGPNAGYLAIYDLAQDQFTVLDDEALMFSQPSAAPDGQTIAYDRGGEALLYDLTTNSTAAFDPTAFSGWSYGAEVRFGSPSYSPDGNQLVWLINGPNVGGFSYGTAMAVFDLH